MASITIRKLSEDVKQRLRMRAAAHGRSMEAEAREILIQSLESDGRPDLAWIEDFIAIGKELGGVDIPEVEDEPATAADFAER